MMAYHRSGVLTRDMTTKVRSVQGVLPHCSEEQCCLALLEADDDAQDAINLLFESARLLPFERVSKTKNKEKILKHEHCSFEAKKDADAQEMVRLCVLAAQPQCTSDFYTTLTCKIKVSNSM